MLLDFNLAVDWRQLDDDAELPAESGGTLAYMAPERLRVIADPRHAPTPRALDRHRADIYGLGLVLLEALTGAVPEVPESHSRSPRDVAAVLAMFREHGGAYNRGTSRVVPAGLRPILARCLAPDPVDRYGSAAELAVDLDRFRNDRPPIFADVPPWTLALARWVRRQRLALAAGLLIIGGGTLTGIAATSLHHGSLQDLALTKLDRLWNGAEPDVYPIRRIGQWTVDRGGIEPPRRFLARYSVLSPGDWRQHDDVRTLPDADRLELEVWIFEQLWRLTDSLADRPDSPDDWRRALANLDRLIEAGILLPEPLRNQARRLRESLGQPEPPAEEAMDKPIPHWMEDYLRGVEADASDPEKALRHYRAALARRPDAFWAHYRAAAVSVRLGEIDAAIEDLRHCIARRPKAPILRILQAGLLDLRNRSDLALEECLRGLELDPDLAEGYHTRSFIRMHLGQTESLKTDFRRATLLDDPHTGTSTARTLRESLLFFGGDLALDPGQPIEDAVRPVPPIALEDADFRTFLAERYFQQGRISDALAQYEAVLDKFPDHLRARYGRALMRRSLRKAGTDREFAALIDHPRFVELLHEDANAIRAFHYVASDRLARGDAPARVSGRPAWPEPMLNG